MILAKRPWLEKKDSEYSWINLILTLLLWDPLGFVARHDLPRTISRGVMREIFIQFYSRQIGSDTQRPDTSSPSAPQPYSKHKYIPFPNKHMRVKVTRQVIPAIIVKYSNKVRSKCSKNIHEANSAFESSGRVSGRRWTIFRTIPRTLKRKPFR
jgi:hypothetical protein